MKASTKMLKDKLQKVIEDAWNDKSVIDTLGASQAKSMCHVFLEAYKGVIFESSLVEDIGRHASVEEIRQECIARAEAAEKATAVERQRYEDADALAREAIDMREAMRQQLLDTEAQLQAVQAELAHTQDMLKLAAKHPDYLSLLADYKSLLARGIEHAWAKLTT